ncbi:MAG TPA: 2-oxoglutarate dehydrogenase complex dihydrolipoyllysine-residue succinyltransferase [Steroidobacteraceae bacterium]|jgi:2-oxoglutarate dehydrogenase E2 component (dihydrolipoamide succinyltransferase)|nr:2-oxoglutarate dehydrogenase complex dihydrolipoyllysine-residue succinyltransferase [Steroidobacteraceae bacterium]
MSTEIRVPQLPESVADATLVTWHKQPGDPIRRDENLADLETDKVVLEVPAPFNGVMQEIRVPSGTVVTSGQVLAVIEEASAAAAATPAARAAAAAAPVREGASAAHARAAAAQSTPAATPRVASAAASAETARDGGRLSPSVRRLVEENHLDPAAIPGSGRDGRLTKADVVDYLGRTPPGTPPTAPAAAAATATPIAAASVLARTPAPRPPAPVTGRAEQRVPMTRLRARIAQRLIEAQSTQALLTTFNEVDLTATQELRGRYRERFEKEYGVKLGFMSFFVKASIAALKKFPVLNASVDGNDIIYHEYYDIGVAVSTDRGLVVPVVRDADGKDFAAIEREIADYARKAREGSIAIEDLTGGTFTITNGGIFGSLMSTPIVNAPQSAILGMHKVQERPMVVSGQIAVRPMMYLAVTYDHRIIDGREAVQFLVAIKEALEDPGRMLLGI